MRCYKCFKEITKGQWYAKVGTSEAHCDCIGVAPLLASPYASEESTPHGFAALVSVYDAAFEQVFYGKGKERHGNGLDFTEQPLMQITRSVGIGFPLGQAMKKTQEAYRLPKEAQKKELLGAINYLAAAVLYIDEQTEK